MDGQWTVPAWVGLTTAAVAVLLVVTLVVTAVALRRLVRRADLGDARVTELLRRVETLESQRDDVPVPVDDPGHPSYVITRLGEAAPEPPAAPVLPPGQFADVVLREGVVASASLLAGLRRALSPEVRHRIRFEMRREVKRARKARRVEQRAALREWQARQRAGGAGGSDAPQATESAA